MSKCKECGVESNQPYQKVCRTCKGTVRVTCACGCGGTRLKYNQYKGVKEFKYIKGHSNKIYHTAGEYGQARADQRRVKCQNFKARIVKHFGGECQKCGIKYDGTNGCIFQFHHRDPSEKDFNIRIRDMSSVRLWQELDKCDMLCANCHFIEHAEEY